MDLKIQLSKHDSAEKPNYQDMYVNVNVKRLGVK